MLVRFILSVCVWIGCYAITYLFADFKDCHYYMMAIRNLPYLGLGIFFIIVFRELINISQMRVYWQFASLRSWLFSFWEKNWLQIKWGA